MNAEEGDTEYLSLKSLLQQWHLPHLLQHFLVQKINVDVLKMMKTQHIFELLQNFPCGDRIRFEYELEKWRYGLGCPLQNGPSAQSIVVQRGMPFEIVSHKNMKIMSRDCETQTQTITANAPELCNRNADDAFLNFQEDKEMSPPPSLSISAGESPKRGGSQSTVYSPRMRVPTPSTVRDPHVRGRPTADLMTRQMAIQLDARDILERCRPRGPELMKIYETNKRFRPVERVELINLFAHYFYEHSIHLPVKLSYELEQQILQLFPGERLRDYRTEKRGKIYIRLSNIKNNRRRAREAKANCLRSLEKNDPTVYDSSKTNIANYDPNERVIDEVECVREENSNSFDKPFSMYVNDIKCETGDEVEFQD